MRVLTFGLLTLMGVLPVACGGGSGKTPSAPTAPKGAEFLKRFETLVEGPWLSRLPSTQGWKTLLGQLRTLESATTPSAPEQLQVFGQELLPRIEILEGVAPEASRLHGIPSQFQAAFFSLLVPKEDPFPLRDRYQDGLQGEITRAFKILDDTLRGWNNSEKSRQGAEFAQGLIRETDRSATGLLNRLNAIVVPEALAVQRRQGLLACIEYLERLLARNPTPPPTDQEKASLSRARALVQHLEAEAKKLRPALLTEDPSALQALSTLAASASSERQALASDFSPLLLRTGATLPPE